MPRMAASLPSDAPAANCPRCAYDLRGEVDRWADECPLGGTCPECGLTFAWSDVLNPERCHVPGFVEHSRGRRGTFVAAWRTWWWACLPWRFWSRVTLEAPLRPWRWIVWLATIFLTARLAAVGVYTGAAAIEYTSQFTRTTDLVVLLGDGAMELFFRGVAYVRSYRTIRGPGLLGTGYDLAWEWRQFPRHVLWVPLLVALPPLVLLLLPETRRRAKVRAGHVLRAAVYSLTWVVAVFLLDVLNALRVFTRTQTGLLILDDWMPDPRSNPDWPMVVTDRSGVIAVVLLFPLAAWLTLWWWFAVRSWRLERTRAVMISLALIWALAVAVVAGPPALHALIVR